MIQTWSASVHRSFASQRSIVWRTGSGARTIVTAHADGAATGAGTGGPGGAGAGWPSAGTAGSRPGRRQEVRITFWWLPLGAVSSAISGNSQRAAQPGEDQQTSGHPDQGLHLIDHVPALIRDRPDRPELDLPALVERVADQERHLGDGRHERRIRARGRTRVLVEVRQRELGRDDARTEPTADMPPGRERPRVVDRDQATDIFELR